MRRYETTFIIDNDLPEEQRGAVIDRVTDLINQHNGLLVMFDQWGTKKLAYEIKKKIRGYYVCADYCGTGTLVDEIERFFRIDDRLLKYMTIVIDKQVDVQTVKDEIAQIEAAAKEEAEKQEALAQAAAAEATKEETSAEEEADSRPPEDAAPASSETEAEQTENDKDKEVS